MMSFILSFSSHWFYHLHHQHPSSMNQIIKICMTQLSTHFSRSLLSFCSKSQRKNQGKSKKNVASIAGWSIIQHNHLDNPIDSFFWLWWFSGYKNIFTCVNMGLHVFLRNICNKKIDVYDGGDTSLLLIPFLFLIFFPVIVISIFWVIYYITTITHVFDPIGMFCRVI